MNRETIKRGVSAYLGAESDAWMGDGMCVLIVCLRVGRVGVLIGGDRKSVV